MKRPIITSVVNHKGGVLKTTTTANLGAALTFFNKRVLVIDVDLQHDLTTWLIGAIPYEEGMPTLYEALMEEESLDHLITSTTTPGLDLIPSSEDLFYADLSLAPKSAREFVLKTCLKKTKALAEYDLVLIDNSPAVSLLTVNSLVASDYFLVPVAAEYLPVTGLIMLGNCIGRLQEKLCPNLLPLGVVLTLYHRTETICRKIERELQGKLGELLFRTRIRGNTKGKAAPGLQQTFFQFEASRSGTGRGSEDYLELGKEVLERLERTNVDLLQLAEGKKEVASTSTQKEIVNG